MRVTLRVIEERAELVARMAQDGRQSGRRAVAEMYEERATEYRQYAEVLRRAVLQTMTLPRPRVDEGGQDPDGLPTSSFASSTTSFRRTRAAWCGHWGAWTVRS